MLAFNLFLLTTFLSGLQEQLATSVVSEDGDAQESCLQAHQEEESDEVTMLMMPIKATPKKISRHRQTLETVEPVSETLSFFQVEAVVEGLPAEGNVQPPPDQPVGLVKLEGSNAHSTRDSVPLHEPLLSTAKPSFTEEKDMHRHESRTNLAKKADSAFSMIELAFVTAFIMTAMLAVCACIYSTRSSNKKGSKFALGDEVQKLPCYSAAELQNLFDATKADVNRPGIAARVEGRIVARTGGELSAPFSSRPCVAYSASVSQQRQDGVHQPPLAYHAAGSDFLIELPSSDPTSSAVQVSVRSNDVQLFEMTDGRFAKESSFSDVADNWKGFTMAHIIHSTAPVQDSQRCAVNRVDFGGKGLLEFCECALTIGATVTCVGEIVQERNGELSMCPWQPAEMDFEASPAKRSLFSRFSTTSWETESTSQSYLAGQVFLSDSPRLLSSQKGGWLKGLLQ